MQRLTMDAMSCERDRASLPRQRRHLFSPWVDFLTLGGGSLVVLGAMAVLYPRDEAARAGLAATMLLLAHFVNHPHFAHSYQLFYKDFARKAFSQGSALSRRYRFAGVMVPAVMAVFFAVALARGNAPLLGLAVNVMFFTVGWHYTKQGYGILMLDATCKGVGFDASERRHLLWNTHLMWITCWLMANNAFAEKDYWGLTYYVLDVPDPVLLAMATLVVVSAGIVVRDLCVRWRAGRALPLNGLVAYVAVHIWLVIGQFDPVLLLVVPLFHSLQYMAVVWRYELNAQGARRGAGGTGRMAWLRSAPIDLARFAIAGGILGAAGFWWAPVVCDTFGPYDRAVFGSTVFLFIAWTFINIHHYFIDNVLWRRENPEIRRHLLAA